MATTKEKNAIRCALSGVAHPIIVELGAHCGEDEPWIRTECHNPPIYVMVEPDMRNCQVILDRLLREQRLGKTDLAHPRWIGYKPVSGNGERELDRRLIMAAISDRDGLSVFHSAEDEHHNRTSGSIQRPTGHLVHIPQVKFTGDTIVPCFTLDTIFNRQELSRIDLLWTDIQGAEREMIAGGREALSHTSYLFMEVENRELYESQALKPELLATMSALGWELTEEFEYNVLLRNPKATERGPR